jgi:hypothetical protein
MNYFWKSLLILSVLLLMIASPLTYGTKQLIGDSDEVANFPPTTAHDLRLPDDPERSSDNWVNPELLVPPSQSGVIAPRARSTEEAGTVAPGAALGSHYDSDGEAPRSGFHSSTGSSSGTSPGSGTNIFGGTAPPPTAGGD